MALAMTRPGAAIAIAPYDPEWPRLFEEERALLERSGLLDRVGRAYVSTQGAELSRDGLVYVRTDGTRTEIGGQAVTVIEGEFRL